MNFWNNTLYKITLRYLYCSQNLFFCIGESWWIYQQPLPIPAMYLLLQILFKCENCKLFVSFPVSVGFVRILQTCNQTITTYQLERSVLLTFQSIQLWVKSTMIAVGNWLIDNISSTTCSTLLSCCTKWQHVNSIRDYPAHYVQRGINTWEIVQYDSILTKQITENKYKQEWWE